MSSIRRSAVSYQPSASIGKFLDSFINTAFVRR
jgi:hypothetical protein